MTSAPVEHDRKRIERLSAALFSAEDDDFGLRGCRQTLASSRGELPPSGWPSFVCFFHGKSGQVHIDYLAVDPR